MIVRLSFQASGISPKVDTPRIEITGCFFHASNLSDCRLRLSFDTHDQTFVLNILRFNPDREFWRGPCIP